MAANPEASRRGLVTTLPWLVIVGVCLLAGCGPAPDRTPPPTSTGRTSPVQATQSEPAAAEIGRPAVALYDLARDEALGGHTLARHVGRSDRELADRLRREPQIASASTYTDEATAARVVTAVIDASRGRIESWERRAGARPNLVLNYTEPGGRPIGRSLHRRARSSVPCHRALVVLRWLEKTSAWYVLTSYPEAG